MLVVAIDSVKWAGRKRKSLPGRCGELIMYIGMLSDRLEHIYI
jgi:hypothetical protein